MIQKEVASLAAAVADVPDGATVMVGGFGTAGLPNELVAALLEQGARELTIVNNNAGNGDTGLAALLAAGRVKKIICSFPRQADSHHFDGLYRAGKIELELVPQGNLAERIRAAGAGIGAFFCPTAYGTDLAKGKETREIDGKQYVLEYPIHGDVALVKAEAGDRWGNLVYRKAARNFATSPAGRSILLSPSRFKFGNARRRIRASAVTRAWLNWSTSSDFNSTSTSSVASVRLSGFDEFA